MYEMQEGLWLWCPRDSPMGWPQRLQLLDMPYGDPSLRKTVSRDSRDAGLNIMDVHLDPTQDLLVLSESIP